MVNKNNQLMNIIIAPWAWLAKKSAHRLFCLTSPQNPNVFFTISSLYLFPRMNFNILMSPLTPHPQSTLLPQSWCFKTSFHIHDLTCSPKIRENKVDSHIKKEWNNTPKGVLIYKTPKTHPLLSSDYPFLTITSSNTPQCVDLSQTQKKTLTNLSDRRV